MGVCLVGRESFYNIEESRFEMLISAHCEMDAGQSAFSGIGYSRDRKMMRMKILYSTTWATWLYGSERLVDGWLLRGIIPRRSKSSGGTKRQYGKTDRSKQPSCGATLTRSKSLVKKAPHCSNISRSKETMLCQVRPSYLARVRVTQRNPDLSWNLCRSGDWSWTGAGMFVEVRCLNWWH